MTTATRQREEKTSGGDWWALLIITLSYGFYNLDKSLLPVLIEPVKAEFQLSDTQMGLLTGLATSVPFALACIPIGLLADRVNRRNLLSLLVIGWSMVTALTYFARTTFVLFVTRVGIGAFEAGFTPVSLSSLSDRFPMRLRSTVIGIFNIGAALGLCMGMIIGGYVEETMGWRPAFLIAGIPGIILGGLLWLTTSEPTRGRKEEPSSGDPAATFAQAIRFVWQDRAMFHIAIGMTWGAAMLAVFAIWTPSLLRRTFELGAADAGLYAALVAGLGNSIGAVAGGIIADTISKGSQARKLWVPLLGTVASVITGLIALHGGLGQSGTIAVLALSALFGQFYIATCYGLAATIAGPQRRGVTLSILLVLFNLISYSLGAGLIGWISDHLSAADPLLGLRDAYSWGYVFSVIALFHFWRVFTILGARETNAKTLEA